MALSPLARGTPRFLRQGVLWGLPTQTNTRYLGKASAPIRLSHDEAFGSCASSLLIRAADSR